MSVRPEIVYVTFLNKGIKKAAAWLQAGLLEIKYWKTAKQKEVQIIGTNRYVPDKVIGKISFLKQSGYVSYINKVVEFVSLWN